MGWIFLDNSNSGSTYPPLGLIDIGFVSVAIGGSLIVAIRVQYKCPMEFVKEQLS
jgi:hypothetical protein